MVRREHADNCIESSLQDQYAAKNCRVLGEHAAPNPIGKYRSIRFARRYAAAQKKRDVQGGEKIVGNHTRIKPAGSIAISPVHLALDVDPCHTIENVCAT